MQLPATITRPNLLLACLLAVALLVATAGTAAAKTFTVNKRGDHVPGKCDASDCTLREAVIRATAKPSNDKIKLPSTSLQWFTFVWASVLGLIGCTLLGIAFSVVPKTGRGASAVVSPIVLVLQFTSGVFFVFSQLPHWMQVFASFFPLKWLAQAMRSVFLPEAAAALEPSGSWELGMCALMLALWCVIGLVLAILFFRWTPRGSN